MKKNKILEQLEKIYKRDGDLTANAIIKEAENPNNPLHKSFEWDDKKIGCKYRIERAQEIIAYYKPLLFVPLLQHPIPVPTFIRNPEALPTTQSCIKPNSLRSKDKEESAKDAVLYSLESALGTVIRTQGVAISVGLDKIGVKIQLAIDVLESIKKNLSIKKNKKTLISV